MAMEVVHDELEPSMCCVYGNGVAWGRVPVFAYLSGRHCWIVSFIPSHC
jgi:hypothetical protein